MGTADQTVDTTHSWDDAPIHIEPTPAPAIRIDTLPPLAAIDIGSIPRPAESPDPRTLSRPHEDNTLPLPHPPGEARKASLQSWETLKDPQPQVKRGQMMPKKMRAMLRTSHRRVDSEQEALLPRLKALDSGYSEHKLSDLICEFQDLVSRRQRLRRAEQECNTAEEQLNADEWHLRGPESTVYGDPVSPFEPNFPAGWLDFTGEEPRRAGSNSSCASAPAKSLPEKLEYDRHLKEVDAWREKLLNLESEHNRLVRQRAKRSRLGLTLDSFSSERLEKYEAEFQYLTSGLDQAETSLEHAEVVWTRRKSTLEQMSQVTDPAINISLSPSHAEPGTTAEDASGQEDDFYELADRNEASLGHQNELASNIARLLQQAEPEPIPVFRVPSLQSNGQNVNMATFINQWLLQRVRQCSEETIRLADTLALANPGLLAEDIVKASSANWLSDGSEKEFIIAVEAGDHSFHESLAPNNGLVEILNDRATSQRLRLNPAIRPGGRVANTER